MKIEDRAGYIEFAKQMDSIDELAHLVLKGHLLIEERLNQIFDQYIFHREHIETTRLTFHNKATICRSLCLRKNENIEWDLIFSLNKLRNNIAHKLDSPIRTSKLESVKQWYFKAADGMESLESVKKEDDCYITRMAFAHSCGYLESFLGDSKAFRQMVFQQDRRFNSDQDPFEL